MAANATNEEKSSLEDKALPLAKYCRENAKCLSYAIGWGECRPIVSKFVLMKIALEELDNPNAPDGKTALMQALLGWPSVDDHMAVRDDPKFGELVGPLRSSVVPPVAGSGMFHVKLRAKPEA